VKAFIVAVSMACALVCTGAGCADEEDTPAAEDEPAPTAARTTTTSTFEAEQDYSNGLVYASQKSSRRFRALPAADASDTEGFARRLIAIGLLHHRFAADLAKLEPTPRLSRAHRVYLAAVRRQRNAYRVVGRLGLPGSATVDELRERLDEARASDLRSMRARRALAARLD
jgi:hypothetical protein